MLYFSAHRVHFDFSAEAISPQFSEKWETAVGREYPIKEKPDDVRSVFRRDYNRILYCNAYRRLKHKTQVFFATLNDHVCTRIEHVHHVVSISTTISDVLGLNVELTAAIALGHDLGHPPFGHEGERVLSEMAKDSHSETFWHEKNSLYIADYIATIQDYDGVNRPLNLTYAVRDGLITHCGEVDQNGLKPRKDVIDLYSIKKPSEIEPYTWEGCVVKIADKIAYLGRDIEDALRLQLLDDAHTSELDKLFKTYKTVTSYMLNSSTLIHVFIMDIVQHSTPEKGITLSEPMFELMKKIKDFNYKHIYQHPKLVYYREYAGLILKTIFRIFIDEYESVIQRTAAKNKFSLLLYPFQQWLERYRKDGYNSVDYEVQKLFNVEDILDYTRAVITYISLMSDIYAIDVFNDVISFR